MKEIIAMPPFLKTGDKVAVVAPSGAVDRTKTMEGLNILKSWGLEPVEGSSLYKRDGNFAGTDEERLTDLQFALDDASVKAVFFARGGYGLSRIIDRVSFGNLIAYPKWLIGYSDISILHYYTGLNTGIPVVHGEMLLNFGKAGESGSSLLTLKALLFDGRSSYQWDSESLVQGECKGILAGGNLSMLCSVPANELAGYLDGKILFIEETGEYRYRVDRMLHSLRLAGIFNRIRGLVIGDFSPANEGDDDFAYSLEDIIMNLVAGQQYPVALKFPAGHTADNRALCLGAEYFFRVDSISSVLAVSAT